jgi:ubiquinone biosynthesis protein UbiJ
MKAVDQTFIAAANHLLRDADWALDRLRPFAGKRARFAIGPLALDFSIAADGTLMSARTDAPVDVTVSMPPALVPRWLADRDAASREVQVEGDSEFAGAISFVAANLRWEFEEDLSRLVGDIAAHRVGETVRGIDRWRRATARSASTNLAEFLTEEKHVLPTRLDADRFMREVDELRDAVERLDKRIARLESRPRR